MQFINWFRSFLPSSRNSDPVIIAKAMPAHSVESPHYAIGDVHGRMDLLEKMHDLIAKDQAENPEMASAKIIYLGDYVDRGDHSAQVLNYLYDLSCREPDGRKPDDCVCLKGNHEVMMLDFLDDPARCGARWLRYGGMQCLASFGLRGLHERMDPADMGNLADLLRDAMPDGMEEWLRNLPRIYRSGNVVFVHAALNPRRAWDDQSDRTRMWGHKDFFTVPREDGHWVAHGHTIMENAIAQNGRISLDTGAYATGHLTAVALSGEAARFLQT